METALDRMWYEHKDYLRRLLIVLTRDIDLADDLLQETYLRAHSGMAAYRDGNPRAWLATICKNVCYSHARKCRARPEVPLEIEPRAAESVAVGSSHYLLLMELQKAIANLKPPLKTALMMKHYGGFTYQEIAEQLECPTGTAKQRVWTAIQKLKKALAAIGEETEEMGCRGLRRTRLLDYLYGVLPPHEADSVRRHLDKCTGCREEADELKKVIAALDAAEGDFKTVRVVDLDASGMPVEYGWTSMVNDLGHTGTSFWWTVNKDLSVDYAMVQGEEVTLDVLPVSDAQYWYEAALPKPVDPGGRVDAVLVLHPKGPGGWAENLEDDHWRYVYGITPNSAKEWVQVLAIRLPPGAKTLRSEPEPTQIKANGRTTLVWRSLLEPVHLRSDGTCPWQFECKVEYDLPATHEAHHERTGKECEQSHLKWAPRLAFEIHDLPWTGAGERALELYREAADLCPRYYRAWFKLGLALYDGEYYKEALEAFRQASQSERYHHPIALFGPLVWQGHMLDLLGRRDEALECYRKALETGVDIPIQHGQYDMIVDRKWVEERLKTPFVRK